MNRIKMLYGALLLFSVSLSPVYTSAAAEEGRGEERIRESLATLLPGLTLGEITPSPLPGVYEVVIGQKLVYVTDDGNYLIQGSLIDLKQQVNLTEPRLNAIKAAAVASLDEGQMVIFGPADAKHTVTVFTDIDCGYCRKLHSEMASYSNNGIRIRYLFFPRAGLNSASYRKAVSVWCADDRKEAMTLAKQGIDIEERECPNPVQADMRLGSEMGVSGTPALLLDSGYMIPGYVPADRLLSILENQP